MLSTLKRLWFTGVAALAIATAALADGDAPTDRYIIGVDSLTTFTSEPTLDCQTRTTGG
jgi:hypothetical protein